MNHRAVKVVWLDSGLHIDKGWATSTELLSDANLSRMECITVGLLMDESDESVAVALNHDPAHDTWLAVQLIARDNIISMEYLT